ncbi:MAG TPA: hypothetical protein VL992_07725 [Tepidisphaeraceae bacterium]|nr:hypothetical protein [Tepidisphaeraceae bacterium]
MIRITCTHCRQLLTIDDGFAGGVCRCQHCGTIQTVPAAAGKSQDRGAAPTAKTLYRAEARNVEGPPAEPAPDTSSLDQLAEIVSSSGLTHSARSTRKSSAGGNGMSIEAKEPPRRLAPLVILLAVAILVIVGVIAMLLMWRGEPAPNPTPQPPPAVTEVAPTGPSFCGMAIDAQDTVVYLLDNGGSASDTLQSMNAACIQSIKSLGLERRFKVVFWRADGPVYPKDATARATPDEIADCQSVIQDAYAQGSTVADGAMKQAMATQPDAIVIVTAKADQLPDDFADAMMSIRGDSSAKIYTVGINGDSSTDPNKPGVLATLAAKSGGKFLNISTADLTRLAHQ